jgi:hypothetical protein
MRLSMRSFDKPRTFRQVLDPQFVNGRRRSIQTMMMMMTNTSRSIASLRISTQSMHHIPYRICMM